MNKFFNMKYFILFFFVISNVNTKDSKRTVLKLHIPNQNKHIGSLRGVNVEDAQTESAAIKPSGKLFLRDGTMKSSGDEADHTPREHIGERRKDIPVYKNKSLNEINSFTLHAKKNARKTLIPMDHGIVFDTEDNRDGVLIDSDDGIDSIPDTVSEPDDKKEDSYVEDDHFDEGIVPHYVSRRFDVYRKMHMHGVSHRQSHRKDRDFTSRKGKHSFHLGSKRQFLPQTWLQNGVNFNRAPSDQQITHAHLFNNVPQEYSDVEPGKINTDSSHPPPASMMNSVGEIVDIPDQAVNLNVATVDDQADAIQHNSYSVKEIPNQLLNNLNPMEYAPYQGRLLGFGIISTSAQIQN